MMLKAKLWQISWRAIAVFFIITPLAHSAAEYKKVNGISGDMHSVGSDTLEVLMEAWKISFVKMYPTVNLQIQSRGSATAPRALIKETASLAPMSRKMNSRERREFQQKFGYQAVAIPVAMDALAVYVNKDNPISGLTLAQVDAIMSSTRQCGYETDITQWGQVGLTDEWASKEITIYGRNSLSGTHSYFRKKAMCKGFYKDTVQQHKDSETLINSVAANVNGIGYSGMGYSAPSVKRIALSTSSNKPFVLAEAKTAMSGEYPLARFLYIYVNKPMGKPLGKNESEFIKMVLSNTGRKLVTKSGYIPLSKAKTAEALALLK